MWYRSEELGLSVGFEVPAPSLVSFVIWGQVTQILSA